MAGEATGYSQTHTQGYLGSLDAYQCCCGGSLSHERLGDRTPGSGDAAVPSEKLRSVNHVSLGATGAAVQRMYAKACSCTARGSGTAAARRTR